MGAWGSHRARRRPRALVVASVAIAWVTTIAVVGGKWVDTPVKEPGETRFTFSPPRVGRLAPDFTLDSIDGISRSLREMRGRAVVMTFLCGCPPCRRWVETAATLSERSQGVVLIGITVMDGDSARRIAGEWRIRFPVLLDRDHMVSQLWDSTSCPRCWVIDPRGRVAYVSSVGDTAARTLGAVEASLQSPAE